MIKVVHVNKASYDVYIGRANGDLPASKWANPFVIGEDGTRDEVIAMYEGWVKNQPDLMAALPELKDKTLGCWCAPERCHGSVLAKLLEELHPTPVVTVPARAPLPPVVLGPDLLLPVFDVQYSYGQCTLTLEEAGKTKPGAPASIVDMALEAGLKQVVVVSERFDGFPVGLKNLTKAGIQFIFGLKLTVVPDMNDKTVESRVNESSIIIFMKDAAPTNGISPSYTDLIKIHNRAWTVGRFGQGRIDWKTLKELWTLNLLLALPFWSSFISRNLLTMASIVPDLPMTPWIFREIDSQIPFAPLIDKAIDQYAAQTPVTIQPVKSIYYRDASSFRDYQIFRASRTRSKGKSGTYSAPGVDNLSSDQFSYEAWRKLVS